MKMDDVYWLLYMRVPMVLRHMSSYFIKHEHGFDLLLIVETELIFLIWLINVISLLFNVYSIKEHVKTTNEPFLY